MNKEKMLVPLCKFVDMAMEDLKKPKFNLEECYHDMFKIHMLIAVICRIGGEPTDTEEALIEKIKAACDTAITLINAEIKKENVKKKTVQRAERTMHQIVGILRTIKDY